MPYLLPPGPCLVFLPRLPLLKDYRLSVRKNKSSSPQYALGQCVYPNNNKQTRTLCHLFISGCNITLWSPHPHSFNHWHQTVNSGLKWRKQFLLFAIFYHRHWHTELPERLGMGWNQIQLVHSECRCQFYTEIPNHRK